MKKKHLEGWQLLGATATLDRLRALGREIPGLRAARDTECLHRMRVASRRLRSTLGIFEPYLGRDARRWRKRIRRMTSTLGRARDLDVQIEFVEAFLRGLKDEEVRAGPRRLLEHLRRERSRAQRTVEKALDELDASGALEAMRAGLRSIVSGGRRKHSRCVRPLEHRKVRRTLAAGVEELLAYGRYVYRPECVHELHEMRIVSKRLRYTLEAFAPHHPEELTRILRVTKKLQGLLGDVHDCDVWVAYLPRFLEELRLTGKGAKKGSPLPEWIRCGIERLREDRRRVREGLYAKLVKLWGKLEEERTWKRFLKRLGS